MKAEAIFTSRCCNSFRRAEHKQEKLHGLAQMQRGRLEPIWPSKLSRHDVVMNTSTPNYKMKTVATSTQHLILPPAQTLPSSYHSPPLTQRPNCPLNLQEQIILHGEHNSPLCLLVMISLAMWMAHWLLNLSTSNYFQLYYCSSLHFTCIPALVLSGQTTSQCDIFVCVGKRHATCGHS
ncbi:hypothetical protein NC652_021100 [Populus alba x Populus x berolinensis]|nr:hypothetical protein NC652_021100 [Populus alba x Populus x berolinensis]